MKAGPTWLVRVGAVLLFATAAIGTSADADLWGHLRFGQDILRVGTVVQADPYSFTTDRPWTNHEWLSEVSFALAYRVAGATGLVLLKLSVIVGLLAVVWWSLRESALASGATFWMLGLTFVGTYWRTHSVRPQLFSVLLFALFLVAMVRADTGRRRGLLLLPLLMALWVNLHGGWIVGLGVFGFWVAVRCLDWRRPVGERLWLAGVGLVTLAATLLNPYGVELWQFLAETVRLERTDIQEWGSILTHPILVGLPWALCAIAAVLAVVWGGWPRRADYLAIILLSAIASFRVSRLDAFLALAVVILLAPQIARAWPASATPPGREAGVGSQADIGVIVITALALVAMLVPAVRIASPYVGCITIGGSWAPDADAGRFIALNHLRGKMLTWFDWGEYAIWHFGPELQVSMDGRRETVYTDRTIQAHQRFYAADDSSDAYLAAVNPDYIWVASHLPIATRLRASTWVPIFSGGASLVFARAGAGEFQSIASVAASPRCFPGP